MFNCYSLEICQEGNDKHRILAEILQQPSDMVADILVLCSAQEDVEDYQCMDIFALGFYVNLVIMD